MYIICFALCFIGVSGFFRPESFLLCNKNSPRKHFAFQEQMKCQPQQLNRVKTCSASIFSTHSSLRKISAYFCFSKEIHWTTHFYFFGSKFKETKVVDAAPPGHLICNSWRYTKQTRDGKLQSSNRGRNYHTDNKVDFEYAWPTAKSGLVRNHYMTNSFLLYDFFADSLSSPVLPMLNCHISVGYCTSHTMTVVWDVTDKGDCPVTQSLGTRDVKLHYNTTSLYRIEIPSLGISIHHWNRCPVRASHCFPSNLFCTMNGIYLSSFHCRNLGHLDIAHTSGLRNFSSCLPDSKFSAFLTEVEDQIAEFAFRLDEQNRLLHCQLERALGIISTTIGRLFPTEILSLALGKPSFGISSGDVLTELNCFRVMGRVLPSLALDNCKKFSLLPLVEFALPRVGKPRQGQLVSPNFILQAKPSYYEKYHPGRTLIFKVNNRYILFENYTATHSNLPISRLHVPLSVIEENFTAKDFSAIHEQFAESQNGLTDLHSLLSVISQTAVDRDDVKHAINMLTSTETDDANMSEVATELQTFAHHTLVLALSEITSPFFTFSRLLLHFSRFSHKLF